MKKVCVLMSTYNGENYIREQLDSILNQKDINLSVLIRDDGSKDNSISIIQSYKDRDKRVNYYCGKNVGPSQSFLDLIHNAPKADYYSFSDQDDVWDQDKLIKAISKLDVLDSNKPNLYYSNLRVVDKTLNFYRYSHRTPILSKNKYSSLVESLPTGCTMVFNSCAEELMRNRIPDVVSMHDTWVYMVCMFFGTCIYDFKTHISYRQHNNNVVGTPLKNHSSKRYFEKIVRLFNRKLQPRYTNANSFYNAFKDILSSTDRIKVEKIVFYKQSIKRWISLLIDRDIKASTKARNIHNTILILLRLI